MGAAMDELRTFLFQTVYARSFVDSGGERIGPLMGFLFAHFLVHPDELPTLWGDAEGERLIYAVTDYVAGMTDPFAQRLYAEMGGEAPGGAGGHAGNSA